MDERLVVVEISDRRFKEIDLNSRLGFEESRQGPSDAIDDCETAHPGQLLAGSFRPLALGSLVNNLSQFPAEFNRSRDSFSMEPASVRDEIVGAIRLNQAEVRQMLFVLGKGSLRRTLAALLTRAARSLLDLEAQPKPGNLQCGVV